MIEPGGSFDRLFIIPSQKAASHYARTQAIFRYDEGARDARPHIYEVEPVGPVRDEAPEHQGSSAKKLKIIREVEFQAPYRYAYPPPWEQDTSLSVQLASVAWKTEPRGRGGKWIKAGFDWGALTHGRYDVPTKAVHALRQHEQTSSGKYPRLAEQIATEGIREPLEVSLHDDGRVVLRGGSHRVNIAHSLGHPTVPVQVVDMRTGPQPDPREAEYQATKAVRARTYEYPVIGPEHARGNSRAVSHEEFQALARKGNSWIDRAKRDSAPVTGLDRHWPEVKARAYAEASKSWGGETIDTDTGQPLPQGADLYALSVKPRGMDTVSVPEDASEAEFSAAMDRAKELFRPALERKSFYLGVFHDDDNNRIDIDPVAIVDSVDLVEQVGAYCRSIGGAFRFSDGNGYFPPHVPEGG